MIGNVYAEHEIWKGTEKEIRFVCIREDGTYITSRTMQHVSRVIHNALNIKDFDYHSLRHTHATVLLERRAPLKYIQQGFGHKKIDITVNRTKPPIFRVF